MENGTNLDTCGVPIGTAESKADSDSDKADSESEDDKKKENGRM